MDRLEWYFGERNIYASEWPVENPRGVVQIVHGMIEHIDRYEGFIRKLNKEGYIVVGDDHMGHGKSASGKKNFGIFTGDWMDLVEDIGDLQRQTAAKYPNLPYIMLGHSMGSFAVRTYASLYGDMIDGLIVMGTGHVPLVASRFGLLVSAIIGSLKGEKYRSKYLHKASLGSYNDRIENKRTISDWLTRDDSVVDSYLSDRYCRFIPSVSMYRAIFEGVDYVARRKNIGKMPKDLPILLISGQEDPVGDYGKGVDKFYSILEDLGFKRVTKKIYPGCRHEILNELNREEVIKYIFNWIVNI